jgi:putative hydrolases of HD superfamily
LFEEMMTDTEYSRLTRQVEFVVEIDGLKNVLRQTLLTDKSRRENSAEHSWHLAIMAILLAEHAAAEIDVARVVKMVLIHDIVEVDCGDVLVYDEDAHVGKAERESAAADRIFGLLPDDQAAEFIALWLEFETRETAEARFAAALDRFQPILHNCRTQGAAWQAHGITADRVLARNRHIADGSPALWEFARRMITNAIAQAHLAPAPPGAPHEHRNT